MCGILITLVTTACYVVMWEMLYFNFMPHFMDSCFAAQIQKVRAAGQEYHRPDHRGPDPVPIS